MSRPVRLCCLVAGFVLPALLWGCAPDPSENQAEPELVDVGPAPDSTIDPEADPRAQPRGEILVAGILPGDFPGSVPVYEPSSLTDHGDSELGLRYVELTVADRSDRVEARYGETLRSHGFESETGESEDVTRWSNGEVAIRIAVSPAGHESVLRIEYAAH